MNCKKCGCKISDDSKFCNNCGTNLSNSQKYNKKLIITLLIVILLFCVGILYKSFQKQDNTAVKNEITTETSKQILKGNNNETEEMTEDERKAMKSLIPVYIYVVQGGGNTFLGEFTIIDHEYKKDNKKYYVFKDKTAPHKFYVDINTREIFIEINGKFRPYSELEAEYVENLGKQVQQYDHNDNNSSDTNTATTDLSKAILGHWTNNFGQNDWYSPNTLYSKGRATIVNIYSYMIISDKNSKDIILNEFKNSYIYRTVSSTNVEKVKYNFTDDMINNSIIVKSWDKDEKYLFTDLFIFSDDRKSYKSYGLNFDDNVIRYSSEFHFVDSQQQP